LAKHIPEACTISTTILLGK